MQSEELYRGLILTSPDGIVQVDHEGILTYASPNALKIFDLASIDEVIGTDMMNWISKSIEKLMIAKYHLLTKLPICFCL